MGVLLPLYKFAEISQARRRLQKMWKKDRGYISLQDLVGYRFISPLLVATVLTAGLAEAAPRHPQPASPIRREPDKTFPSGVEWRLVEINGKRPPAGADASLSIDSALRGSGRAGCNSWSASLWPAPGQRLLMGAPALTRKACPAPVMAFERSFLTIVAAQSTWDIVSDDLVVRSRAGTLRFSRGL
jgi:heat shock protein HslJ